MSKCCSAMCAEQHLLIGPQTPPYRGNRRSGRPAKGFDQAFQDTHPLRRRVRSKTRSCSDACPEALRSALDRSAAEGGGTLQGGRMIGRGGAHGATASRFPVSLAQLGASR